MLPLSRTIPRLLLAAALVSLLVFIAAYLTHAYQPLADWYLGLRPELYRAARWQTDFFTPAVKARGNLLCAAAIPVAAVLLYGLWRSRSAEGAAGGRAVSLQDDGGPLAAVLAVAGAAWVWGAHTFPPGADEAFSAQYAAGDAWFRTLSYYMLPNNHVLFNLLNGALPVSGRIGSGRVLSGLAYLGTAALLYQWLRERDVARWPAAAAAGVCLLQLPVWGFAFQARGYELHLLAHWWAFSAVCRYVQGKGAASLRWYPLAAVVGYGTVPSFLFFHAALAAWVTGVALFRRETRLLGPFWRAQIAGGAGAFLFYLPALCFSGSTALTANRFVAPGAFSARDYLLHGPPFGGNYPAYVSGGWWGAAYWGLVLALLPLLLLLGRRSRNEKALGALFAVLWLVLTGCVLLMQHLPFHRNLIGFFSVSLALGLVGGHAALRPLASGRVLFGATCLVLAGFFAAGGRAHLDEWLYFNSVRATAAAVGDAIAAEPPDPAAFSEEAFLYRTYWMRAGRPVASGGQALLFMRLSDDPESVVPAGYRRDTAVGEAVWYRRLTASAAR